MNKLVVIKERLKKAMPGPWSFQSSMDQRRGNVTCEALKADICFYDPSEPISYKSWKFNNFDLIGNAPQDLQLLLTCVEKVKSALETMRKTDGTSALHDIVADTYKELEELLK